MPACIELTDEVVNNLSTDQKNAYRKIKAVTSGILSKELSKIKCGTMCQSRSGTTREALMMILMSHHGLKGEDYKKLRVLVTFCVNGYFKLFFDIKVKHNHTFAPSM